MLEFYFFKKKKSKGKILFWFLNFTKNLFFTLKLKKIIFSSLDFVNSFFFISLEKKKRMKKEKSFNSLRINFFWDNV